MIVPFTSLAALLWLGPAQASVDGILSSYPADSLMAPLARYEAAHRGSDAAEAALTLGRLHYARGEYRQAAADFARATSRSNPDRRGEVQYWTGLAWLGAGEASQARAAFEGAARSGSSRRPEAQLGVALCWEAARRPERALETLQALLAGDPGEAGPAALERVARIATRLDRPELGRRARERLMKDYPRSIEAVRSVRPPDTLARVPRAVSRLPAPSAARVAPPPVAAQGPLAVQIGVFHEQARANELAELARRDGFAPVRVAALTDARGRYFAVRVGVYATAGDARGAGERIGRALGVAWRVVPAP
jgi:tetratricopeptide (TPR) repeat protein